MPAKDPDAMLQKILATPETAQIAETLGIPVEEYAKQVLFYALNPNAEPQLEVMSEADAKANGLPTMGETVDFLKKIDSGEISVDNEHERSRFAGFDDGERDASTATGQKRVATAPKDGEAEGRVEVKVEGQLGSALKGQVLSGRDMARQGMPRRDNKKKGDDDGAKPAGKNEVKK